MKYKLSNIEHATASNGNPYKKATFTGQDGVVTEKIGVFADSPVYGMIVEGGVVEGNITKNTKGYNNFSPLNDRQQSTGGFRGGGAAKAVAEKQKGIKESMDRKEEGIKVSSTFRAAYETTLAQLSGRDFEDSEFQKQFSKWRKYFMQAYEINNNLTSEGTLTPFTEVEDDGLDQIQDVAF